MEGKEENISKEGSGDGGNSKGGDGFIDRSKVRILLCDTDAKNSEEVFTLLLKCSYQVISVRSARQVIDVLNSEGPDIDIILTEVDLPMRKGMKMLKYITRDKELRHIPVIMMSAQDEVSIVVKCLSLGAADYLVKPLRTNELLNLWIHMWRRRRMLGLVEKNILNYDLVVSDHTDANTASTTLFSDDTDDKSQRSTNPEMGMSTDQRDESIAVAVEPLPGDPDGLQPDVLGIGNHRTGQLPFGPKRSQLKIGESSAFFTYVKSSTVKNNFLGVAYTDDKSVQSLRIEEESQPCGQQKVNDVRIHENGEAWESHSQDDFPCSSNVPDSLSLERSYTLPLSKEFPQRNFKDKNLALPHVLMHPRNEPQVGASGLSLQNVYPYFMSGVVNRVIMPSNTQLYQKNMHGLQSHASSAMLPQYNHLPQRPPHMTGMASFPYYPVSMCLQPGQMSTNHSWASFGSSPSADVKLNKEDRREAALMKFRQKRKERCFDKKIRYANRKKLAERRPRVRGQFVRKINGVNVDLNGQREHVDYDDDGNEEDDDEHASMDSSPDNNASGS